MTRSTYKSIMLGVSPEDLLDFFAASAVKNHTLILALKPEVLYACTSLRLNVVSITDLVPPEQYIKNWERSKKLGLKTAYSLSNFLKCFNDKIQDCFVESVSEELRFPLASALNIVSSVEKLLEENPTATIEVFPYEQLAPCRHGPKPVDAHMWSFGANYLKRWMLSQGIPFRQLSSSSIISQISRPRHKKPMFKLSHNIKSILKFSLKLLLISFRLLMPRKPCFILLHDLLRHADFLLLCDFAKSKGYVLVAFPPFRSLILNVLKPVVVFFGKLILSRQKYTQSLRTLCKNEDPWIAILSDLQLQAQIDYFYYEVLSAILVSNFFLRLFSLLRPKFIFYGHDLFVYEAILSFRLTEKFQTYSFIEGGVHYPFAVPQSQSFAKNILFWDTDSLESYLSHNNPSPNQNFHIIGPAL